jgi:hypothetical protein
MTTHVTTSDDNPLDDKPQMTTQDDNSRWQPQMTTSDDNPQMTTPDDRLRWQPHSWYFITRYCKRILCFSYSHRLWGCHLGLSSDIVIWHCHLMLLFGVVMWIVIWCCHVGCHLGLSSDVFIWGCHLTLLAGVVIWGCHLMSSGVVIWCHLELSSDVVIWRCHIGCHLGLSSGLSSSVVIGDDTLPILFIYWKLYSLLLQ